MSEKPLVIIADDDDLTRATFKEAIAEAGGQPLEASNGNEALDLLAAKPAIDLLVIDLVMPEKEGIETIREVLVQYPNTRIVALSGHSEYLKLVESLNILGTLMKPDDLENLTERISGYLEQRSG